MCKYRNQSRRYKLMASYIVPRPRRAGSGNEAKLYHADSLRNVLYTSRVQTLVVRLRLQTYFTQEVVIRVDSKLLINYNGGSADAHYVLEIE